MTQPESARDMHPCRSCRLPVDPQASKCPHCHESLTARSPFQAFSKKIIAWIGLFTALLSVFYALKEGYFYIEQRQQTRDLFAAHLNAAEQFVKLDNLGYAEASLQQALQLNPNDRQLRLKYFLLRSHNLLREVDYYGSQLPAAQLQLIPDLVTDGFSLLESGFSAPDRSSLLIALARLLQNDQRWQNPAAIGALFSEARQLVPSDAEVKYQYGQWLLTQDPPDPQGFPLVQQAVEADPGNPVYLSSLGSYQAERGDYADAFKTLIAAIELRPQQHELQRIRASNEAKHGLRQALLSATDKAEIGGADFFGLNLAERVELVEYVLQLGSSHRQLELLAARLYHHAGRDELAEPLLRNLLGRYNERSNQEQLELFAEVLSALDLSAEATEVRRILQNQRELANFEEILETGLEGQHRYKVGLRVAKQNSRAGIEVLKVYEGYPFAKAGVEAGDRLLEFAHRRVTELRSIWVPMLDFSPGTDVPLKLVRGDRELSLVLIIE